MDWRKMRVAIIAIVAVTAGCKEEKKIDEYTDHIVALAETDERQDVGVEEEPPSHYDHLKELEWLVGDWVDDDKNVDFTSSWKWDKYKNFLTQRFTVSSEEKGVDFEGQQIVAWDPFKEKVRSWVFDSDGGFGEGYWEKNGNSWYASMVFTLPDGRRGSSLHIFTKMDDRTYTFAAEARDVDGAVLPDIGPFKIIRK